MAKFAKVFDIGDDQVLVTRSYNADDEKDEISFRTDINGLEVGLTLGFDDDIVADAEFESIGQERSQDVYSQLKAQVDAMMEGNDV